MSKPQVPQIRVVCRHCNHHWELPADFDRDQARCPRCNEQVVPNQRDNPSEANRQHDEIPTFDLPDDMRWVVPPEEADKTGEQARAKRRERVGDLPKPPLPFSSRDPFSAASGELPEVEGNDGLDLFSAHGPADESTASMPSERLSSQTENVSSQETDPEPLDPDHDILAEDDASHDNPDEPLRIDIFDAAESAGDAFAIRCPVCDSRIFVPRDKAGEWVECPDCFTKVEAIDRSPDKPKSFWSNASSVPFTPGMTGGESQPSPDSLFGDGELRLSDPEPGGDPTADAPSLDSDAEAAGDMLRHRPPPRQETVRSEQARWKSSQAEREEAKRRDEELAKTSAMPRRARWANPELVPDDDQQKDRTAGSAAELDDPLLLQATSFEHFGLSAGPMFKWLSMFLRGAHFWARFAAAAIAWGLVLWLFFILRDIVFGEQDIAPRIVALVGSALLFTVCGAAAVALIAILTGQVFERAVEKRVGFDGDPGWSWQDWGPPFLYLLVGLFLGGLPGAFLGTVVWMATGAIVSLFICWSLFAMLIAPVILASAYFNGSPYLIFAPQVLKMVRADNLDWMKFLPLTLACWLVLVGGLVMGELGSIPTAMAAGTLFVLAWVAYASFVGLYCALLVAKVEEQS